MLELIVYSKKEDGFVTFERSDKTTIEYPAEKVDVIYQEGDVIKAIIFSEDDIEFFGKDEAEMQRRKDKIKLQKILFLKRFRKK